MRVLLCTEGEDLLHPIDLLPQEDVHGDEAAEPSQGVLHLVRHVIPGKFPQHVLRYLKHERFPGRTKSFLQNPSAPVPWGPCHPTPSYLVSPALPPELSLGCTLRIVSRIPLAVFI